VPSGLKSEHLNGMLFLACSVCKIVYYIYSISYSIRLFNQSVTPKCNNNTYYNLQFKKHKTFHTQWMPITILKKETSHNAVAVM
jgi:hypothetical protein